MSLLRWAGSKKQLLPTLKELFDASECHRYIELFCGSAALFFKLDPEQAILNDINPELVNSLRCVRDSPHKVYDQYNEWATNSETYYKIREMDLSQKSSVFRAATFLYLMRFCYGGVYRTNLNGKFNVPFGGSNTGALPSLETLIQYSNSLKKCSILNTNYDCIIEIIQKGDFVYLDPPYYSSCHTYGASSIELEKIIEDLKRIDNQGARFVLSYSYNEEIIDLVKAKWNYTYNFVAQTIAAKSKNRKKRKELLVTNIEQ